MGVSIRSGQALLKVRLSGYGYGNSLGAIGTVAPTAQANRLRYRYGSLDEWYVNGPLGLEQGFTLTARPTGRRVGPLTLALGISGNTSAAIAGAGEVTFSHGGSALAYRALVVTDARGQTLPSWLQLRGRELLLRIDAARSEYPLQVDPFIQQAKLTASDGAANDELGNSVAVSGDTIVAGAPNAMVDGNAGQGAAYVFVASRAGWANATETAKLTASDSGANDGLGVSVGISGDTVVAGSNATIDGHADQGAVYVFRKPWDGWRTETQAAKLTASDGAANDFLGLSVAIQGGTVVAGSGATINDHASQGAAYVFLEPRGGWRSETQAAKLTASDGAANDFLGWSVAIDGGTIAASAPFATINGNAQQGAVYVFVEPRGSWRSETQAAKLTASDGAANDFLGNSVAVSGGTVVTGAPNATANGPIDDGATYVFVKAPGGWHSETQTAKLTPSNEGGELGEGVAILDRTIVAGAPTVTLLTDGNGEQGAAYVFDEPPSGWRSETQTRELMGSDLASVRWLGLSVAVSGDTLVAGAPATTVSGNAFQGAVYVFGHGSGGFQIATAQRPMPRDARRTAALRRFTPCTGNVAHREASSAQMLRTRSRDRSRCLMTELR